MTETTTNNTKGRSLAEMIREDKRPTGELFELSGQAARLGRSINVARRWVEAAAKDDAQGEMWERAEAIHDELEEELSRVAWEMEIVSEKRRETAFNEERDEERRVEAASLEAVARASCLGDSLLETYNVLAQLPEDLIALGGSETGQKTRYRLMGALLAAKDAAEAELERLDPRAQV